MSKYWLGMAALVLMIGVVIAGVGAIFNILVGIPAKDPYRQVVTQTQSSKATPVEIKREPVAPAVQRTPATNTAVAMTQPQIIVPEPQIVAPERKPTRRVGSFRLGF
jgi:hypothetical protein